MTDARVRPGGSDLIFRSSCDAPASTTISNDGGAIIANIPLQLLFWGSSWNANPSPSIGQVINAVNSILEGPYMTGLGQYAVGRGSLQGAWIVTGRDPNNPFSDDEAHSIISDLIDQGSFPEPDDPGGRNLYMLILPANIRSSKANLSGEHTYDTDYDFPFDYDKAWFGWVTHNGTLDSLTPVFSHELVEACTDPEGDGVQVNPRNDSNWNEIGDVCCSTARLNGILVQSYWSDRDKACIISTGLVNGLVAGTPALIQSRFGQKGNFELGVSLAAGGLAHYWRNNDDPFLPWFGPNPFAGAAGMVDAATMIESNFGSPGNLEVVARSGNQLVFFWRDSGPSFLWRGPFALVADGVPVTGVSGNPALIQSRFGNMGNFELLVPLASGGLAHFWRDNDDPQLPWHGPNPFGGAAGMVDAATMIESNFGSPGNLEVVARIGNQLVFFWRDSGPGFIWSGPFPLTSGN